VTRGRLVIQLLAAGVVVAVLLAASCAVPAAAPRTSQRRRPATGPSGPLWTLSDRGIKSDLIMHMPSSPQLLVLGGSRALRFEPGFIKRLTGLDTFNAAVPQATPQDEWSIVNLMHSRFPRARFQVLWVIHCDEFDEYSPGAALLEDPFLSRFLPQSFVASRLDAMGPAARAELMQNMLHPSVIAPDGFTLSDTISAAAQRGTLRQRVDAYTGSTLSFYRSTPPRIEPQPRHYFAITLALLNRLGIRPTIVLAPLQPWYLARIYGRGWEARHRLVLAYLHHLERVYRFNVLDFSRLASIGGSPSGFYDAVHLRPQTTRLVVMAVLRSLPHAFTATLTARR
jgi:hypothetical protein